MKVSQALEKRQTIRGYKPDEVPEDILLKILQLAQLSPSNCNTQPWHFTIVSGEARKKLENALLTEILSGKKPAPIFTPGDASLEGVYKDRQYDCAFRYYDTMGIGRADKDKRQQLMVKNWQFFGAPHVGFLTMPASMGAVNAIDMGIYLQSLMLLFVEHGIASCPQGALAYYPDPVFEIANIPDGNAILVGISFGYEDVDAQINNARMPRADVADCVTLIR